jgi:NACHT domain- and WD repeat-containing protein
LFENLINSRVRDGKMLANYRLSAELTAIETTEDGRCIVVGTVDGCLSVLAIADPLSPDPYQFLASLPSRSMQVSFDKTLRSRKRKERESAMSIFHI